MQPKRETLSHLIEKPCRVCGARIRALENGRVNNHPICSADRLRLEREFKIACRQRAKQTTTPRSAP